MSGLDKRLINLVSQSSGRTVKAPGKVTYMPPSGVRTPSRSTWSNVYEMPEFMADRKILCMI